MMETKEWKLKCVVNDDKCIVGWEKNCFILKKQLDEEKNVLRNTLMYINSHSREIPKLHPKLLKCQPIFQIHATQHLDKPRP